MPHLLGAEVVFSDVDPDTGLIRQRTCETRSIKVARQRYPSKTLKAIFVVHMNGQPLYARHMEISAGAWFYLIEDACHALGARTKFDLNLRLNALENANFPMLLLFRFTL